MTKVKLLTNQTSPLFCVPLLFSSLLSLYFLSQSHPDALESCVLSLSHQGASVPLWDTQHCVCLHPEPSGSSQAVPPCFPSFFLFSSYPSFSSLLAHTGPSGLPVSLLPPWGAGGGPGGPGCGPPASSVCFSWDPQGPGTTTLSWCVYSNR